MSIFGQISSVCIAVIGLGGGLFLAYHGCALTGLSAFIGTLGTLASVIVYNRHKDAKDKTDSEKAPAEKAEVAQ